MIEFAECPNVRITGVTIKNSPGWTIRPIACENVVIDNILIRNPSIGVNGDGIDITCSQNVLVSNCDIAAGDDAICLKSDNPDGDTSNKKYRCHQLRFDDSMQWLQDRHRYERSLQEYRLQYSTIYADTASPINTDPISGISVRWSMEAALTGSSYPISEWKMCGRRSLCGSPRDRGKQAHFFVTF